MGANSGSYLKLAVEKYLSLGRLEAALAVCQANTQDALAYKLMGDIYEKMGDWEQAQESYHQALKLQPDWGEVYESWGNLKIGQGKWHSAIKLYEQALACKPGSALIYRNLARAWSKLGRKQQANSYLYQAVRKNAGAAAEELLGLGDDHLAEGKWHKALDCYSRAGQKNPQLAATAQEKIIHCYYAQLKQDPENTRAVLLLGRKLEQLGRLTEAVAVYKEASKINPDLGKLKLHLGNVFLQLGRFQEAAEAYSQAVVLNPQEAWYHYGLGKALAKMGDWKGAAKAYEQAIAIFPDFHWSHYGLGEALKHLNQEKEAKKSFHQGRQLAPELPWFLGRDERETKDPDKYLHLGNLLVRQGKYLEAIKVYDLGLSFEAENDLLGWQLRNTYAMHNREFAYPVEMIEHLRPVEPVPLTLNTSDKPVVSIIIPVYGKVHYTYNCIRSLKAVMDGSIPYEVIVMDDHSPDNTREVLAEIKGIRYVYNEENLGFLGSCNKGGGLAKGEYIFLLNNDTVVMPNCLEEMLETFKNVPDAGFVGAKFLYGNGQLQEAGGIFWQDGSAWNYGRMDQPNKPEYCYLREVDYCSGAGIMLPKWLWDEIGGFDVRYTPAYYEDSDLAFAVKKAGYKVLYQPLAQIVHFEGISSGTDVTKGVKKYQVVNQEKFFGKWEKDLQNFRKNGEEPLKERERKIQKRLLMLDATILTPDQDSGSVTAVNLIKIFQQLGYKVTFAPDNLLYDAKYTTELQRIGVECLYCSYVTDIKEYLRTYGWMYDVVYISRMGVAHKYMDAVKELAPQAKIIYDTVDLHFLRERRQAELTKDKEVAKQAERSKEIELELMRKADFSLVVSMKEREMLKEEFPDIKNVGFFHMPREIYGSATSFEERENLVFIGGFRHTPNVDAMVHFVKEVLPLVKEEIKNIKLYIIGAEAPGEILDLASESVAVLGHMPEITDYFNRVKMSVAPLRYGAGIKGKILTSLSYGVPVIATSIAAEGMGLEAGREVLIGDTAENFAEQVIRLYNDASLWNQMSRNAIETMKKGYSMAAVVSWFDDFLKQLAGEEKE